MVKNINAIAEAVCSCGSWLRHWQKFSGQLVPHFCPEIACLSTDLVGAHVRKVGFDERWYIVPLCAAHSRSMVSLTLTDNCPLVPAGRALTCEKPRKI
jgi:hypothetical protein